MPNFNKNPLQTIGQCLSKGSKSGGSAAVPAPAETFKPGDILYWTRHRGTTPPPPSCPPPSLEPSIAEKRKGVRVTLIKKHETVIAEPPRGSSSQVGETSSRIIAAEEVDVFYDIQRHDDETVVERVNGKELTSSFIL